MYTTTATNGSTNTVTMTSPTPATTSYNNQRLVDPFLVWLLSVENNFVCLRDKRTKQIYNVSYTESGLMHTFQAKNGACLYFNPATTQYTTSTTGYFNPSFKGKKDKNPNVYVEKYVPMNHLDKNGRTLNRMQTAEIFMVGKAQKLAMPMNEYSAPSLLELRAKFEAFQSVA